MNNYYELLKVASDASHTEIETRLDDQYTKWRALVTHHDPNVVDQANQALNTLEEIRATLLDQDKRSAYDKILAQEQEKLGGLADPDIVIAQNPMRPVMAPPRPRATATSIPHSTEVERTDAWICSNPKCRKANPIGTQFCTQCGKRIGIECPNCGVLTQGSNKFCENCGVNIQEALTQQEEAKRIAELERQKYLQYQATLEPIRKKASTAKTFSSLWWWLLGGIGYIFWIIGLCYAISILNSPQIPGDEEYRQMAKTARTKTLIALGIVFFMIAITIIIVIANY